MSACAHFDTEFIRPVRFALADALDLWRMQEIDLAAALAALLLPSSATSSGASFEGQFSECCC